MQDSNTESSVLLVAPLVPLETVDNDVIECEELQEDILVSMESPTSIVTGEFHIQATVFSRM
jgi:hypothetical protein